MAYEWLARRRPSLEPNTFRDYSGIVERRLRPHLGHHEVKHLRRNRVVAMLDAKQRPGANKRGKVPRPLSETFLDSRGDDRLFPLLRLASHTGARRSELLALRWSAVDLRVGTASIASRRTRVKAQEPERLGWGSAYVDPRYALGTLRRCSARCANREPTGEASRSGA